MLEMCFTRCCSVVVGDTAVPVNGNGQVTIFFTQHKFCNLFQKLMSLAAHFGHASERILHHMPAQVKQEVLTKMTSDIRILESTRHM
jgi:hypothetical protein